MVPGGTGALDLSRPTQDELAVSVIVPAYNEAARLPATLDALESHLASRGGEAEIIVVDDGSIDATAATVERRPRGAVRVASVRLPVNRGKGRAVVAGVAASRGRVVAFIDADLPYTLANLDEAVRLVAGGEADIALGARDLPASSYDPSYPLARQIAGRTYAALVRLALGLPFGDTQCGLKSFRRASARALFPLLTIDGYGFDVELVYLACTRRHRIVRFPVTLSHRHESRVRLARDSFRMFGDLWRVRRNEARGVYGERPGSARA
ncbi:MAG: glycosyltransferase [Deltaproteobacteria bacterium]|nr:glycosyltransferase [Deltaproteobacteria bacterium]